MIQEKYEQWLNHPAMDADLKEELLNMTPEQKHDAFYTNINSCLYSFTEKINPQQHSLYKLLKEKTGLFK